MSVYAPAADYLWELIREYDLDPEPFFREAGIDPKLRFDPQGRISREKVNHLNRLIFEATDDIAVGVRSVSMLQPGHLGALGYAWLASLTLRAALDKFQRYSNMVAHAYNQSYAEVDDEVRVSFFWTGDWEVPAFQRFATMANLVNLLRHLMGPSFNPLRVEFWYQEPDDLEPFEKHFRCPMSFGHGHSTLVLPRSQMDAPLPRGHAELAQASDEMVVRYLADLDREDIVGRVRAKLVETMELGHVSIETVAQHLNMSSRTLRRKLEDRDITFRDVLSEFRKERALRLIKEPSYTLTEISYMLGFSEPSSFSRAFRGWTGKSPTAARTSG